jgi:hypothetical protein
VERNVDSGDEATAATVHPSKQRTTLEQQLVAAALITGRHWSGRMF